MTEQETIEQLRAELAQAKAENAKLLWAVNPGNQIGWFHPDSRRFCYLDERNARPDLYEGYSMPVFVCGE